MNIPYEAEKRYPHTPGWRGVFIEGAEWARKEALREVCDWLTSDLKLRHGMDTYTMTGDCTQPEVVLEFVRDELRDHIEAALAGDPA